MSIVLPNASASELSGLSDSDSGGGGASGANSSHSDLLPGQPKYKCPLCSLRFRRRDALDRHEAQHTGDRKFVCTVRSDCKRSYTNASHLRRHVRTAHGARNRTAAAGDIDGESTPATTDSLLRDGFVVGGIKCSQPGCPRVFVRAAAMALHASQTHSKRKEHQCPDCPESFYRKQQLKAHQHQHTGVYPHKCAGCALGFLKRRLLDRHQRAAVGGCEALATSASRQHRCEFCERTFAKWSELVAHRRVEHRPRCERCDRTFATRANLRAHMESVHRDVEPPTATTAGDVADTSSAAAMFVCTEPTCDKEFAHERNMLAHWRLHHGGQRFECERCGMQLSSKRKLEQHLDWHQKHPAYEVKSKPGGRAAQLEKRFECEVAGCARRYVRLQALVEHMRRCHPGEELPAKATPTAAERLAGLVAIDEDESAEDVQPMVEDGDAGQRVELVEADAGVQMDTEAALKLAEMVTDDAADVESNGVNVERLYKHQNGTANNDVADNIADDDAKNVEVVLPTAMPIIIDLPTLTEQGQTEESNGVNVERPDGTANNDVADNIVEDGAKNDEVVLPTAKPIIIDLPTLTEQCQTEKSNGVNVERPDGTANNDVADNIAEDGAKNEEVVLPTLTEQGQTEESKGVNVERLHKHPDTGTATNGVPDNFAENGAMNDEVVLPTDKPIIIDLPTLTEQGQTELIADNDQEKTQG